MAYTVKPPDTFLRRRQLGHNYPVLSREKQKRQHNSALPSAGFKPKPVTVSTYQHADLLDLLTREYFPDDILQNGTLTYDGYQSYQKRPGWKVEVAKGQDATNTYERVWYNAKNFRFSGVCRSSRFVSNYNLSGASESSANDELEWTSLNNEAAAKVRHKLDGNIGKAQLAAPIAESREIHRLVRQINSLGLDTVKSLLAIRKTKGLSALKQFGNIWLGFGFGVNPMLKDIESAANSILDYNTREDRHVRLVGTASREHTGFSETSLVGAANGLKFKVRVSGSFSQSSRMVVGVDLKLRSAASYSVLDHLGLKVEALPATLWELTPFSWAVDYFATVGPWLDDMFYTLPGVVKYCSLTQKYLGVSINTPILVPNSGYTYAGPVSPGELIKGRLTRSTGSLTSVRPIRIKSVDEIANHGLNKLLNLSSVLAQKWGPHL
jgi:hypothetical protein